MGQLNNPYVALKFVLYLITPINESFLAIINNSCFMQNVQCLSVGRCFYEFQYRTNF